MILSANELPEYAKIVGKMAQHDPFACRIISLFHSYRPGLAFVDYWLTRDTLNGDYTGAIARNGSNFLLLLTDKTDLGEISSFLRISGASGVIGNGAYPLDWTGKVTHGAVLECHTITEDDEKVKVITPDIKAAYHLIVSCEGEGFQPPEFDSFYVDVNHKLRHHTMRLCGIEDNGKLAALAMTVAESETAAVLGAVACAPEYRRKGYGSIVVKHLTNALVAENKRVYLHRAQNANVRFYQKLGFTECGQWREYHI